MNPEFHDMPTLPGGYFVDQVTGGRRVSKKALARENKKLAESVAREMGQTQ